MEKFFTRPWLKALAGLSINLSAGWYGAVIIVPNFGPLNNLSNLLVLTTDFIFGTVCLLLSVKIEEILEHE